MLIKRYLFTPILNLISFLPLSWLRGIGALLGMLLYKFSSLKGKLRLQNNLLITGMCKSHEVDYMARETAKELCKTLVETATIAWFRSKKYNSSKILKYNGLELVETAAKENKPIVFLTPHIGNFEIALKATAYKLKNNFTVLYKPSKDKWYNELMLNGRGEDNIKPVPTNSRGVLSLIKALKKNEYIGILPDSVASQGDGTWVKFFGNKVFATTLAAKMVSFANAATFVVSSKRAKGGFIVDYVPYSVTNPDITVITQEIYLIIESMVLKAKEQYFWSYDRFRVPSHA